MRYALAAAAIGLAFLLVFLTPRTEEDPAVIPAPPVVQSQPGTEGTAGGGSAPVGLDVLLPDFSTLGETDPVSLRVPHENRVLAGRFERVTTTASGNRVLQGRLIDEDAGQSYPFIFTVGQYMTFGTVQTSRNRYQIEARGDSARMVAATSLKKQIDYSVPDYVMPVRQAELPRTGSGE